MKTGWVLAVAAWLSRNAPDFLQPPPFPLYRLPLAVRVVVGGYPHVGKLINELWWEAGVRFALVGLAAGLIVGVPIGVFANVLYRHYHRASEVDGER